MANFVDVVATLEALPGASGSSFSFGRSATAVESAVRALPPEARGKIWQAAVVACRAGSTVAFLGRRASAAQVAEAERTLAAALAAVRVEWRRVEVVTAAE